MTGAPTNDFSCLHCHSGPFSRGHTNAMNSPRPHAKVHTWLQQPRGTVCLTFPCALLTSVSAAHCQKLRNLWNLVARDSGKCNFQAIYPIQYKEGFKRWGHESQDIIFGPLSLCLSFFFGLNTEVYCLRVLETKNLKSRHWQSCFLLRAVRGDLCQASRLHLLVCWQSLVFLTEAAP